MTHRAGNNNYTRIVFYCIIKNIFRKLLNNFCMIDGV